MKIEINLQFDSKKGTLEIQSNVKEEIKLILFLEEFTKILEIGVDDPNGLLEARKLTAQLKMSKLN